MLYWHLSNLMGTESRWFQSTAIGVYEFIEDSFSGAWHETSQCHDRPF